MSRASSSARKRGVAVGGEASGSSPKRGRGRPPKIQSGDLPALEEIGEKILRELGRRLEDEEEASKLAPTGLMAIAQKYVNYLDLKARLLQQQKDEEKDMPVLDLLNQEGLDPVRKMEVLTGYIASLESDLADANAMRETISGGS